LPRYSLLLVIFLWFNGFSCCLLDISLYFSELYIINITDPYIESHNKLLKCLFDRVFIKINFNIFDFKRFASIILF
jgi:hypothetical protein